MIEGYMGVVFIKSRRSDNTIIRIYDAISTITDHVIYPGIAERLQDGFSMEYWLDQFITAYNFKTHIRGRDSKMIEDYMEVEYIEDEQLGNVIIRTHDAIGTIFDLAVHPDVAERLQDGFSMKHWLNQFITFYNFKTHIRAGGLG